MQELRRRKEMMHDERSSGMRSRLRVWVSELVNHDKRWAAEVGCTIALVRECTCVPLMGVRHSVDDQPTHIVREHGSESEPHIKSAYSHFNGPLT